MPKIDPIEQRIARLEERVAEIEEAMEELEEGIPLTDLDESEQTDAEASEQEVEHEGR